MTTARELGIPMPLPTVRPALTALAIVVMFSGLLFLHEDKKALALAIVIGGAAFLVAMLYWWLLSPLEEEH